MTAGKKPFVITLVLI